MNARLEGVVSWWWSRSARERQMLTIMALMTGAVLAWLLVLRPVTNWRDAAEVRRHDARLALFDVDARVNLLTAAGTTDRNGREPTTARADIEPLVRQSAEAVGLALTTGMDPSAGLGFRMERTTSAQLFSWLAALKADHGLEVTRLTVVENADATLQVEGGFDPRDAAT